MVNGVGVNEEAAAGCRESTCTIDDGLLQPGHEERILLVDSDREQPDSIYVLCLFLPDWRTSDGQSFAQMGAL